eukprot:m.242830 g.242830  ORF g.242830 m.242830 type:complete len:353 (+) comp26322_c0_seq1:172-1230(+)
MPVVLAKRSILRPTQTSARSSATSPLPRRTSGLTRASFSSLSSSDSGVSRDENTPRTPSTGTTAAVDGSDSAFSSTPDSSLGLSPLPNTSSNALTSPSRDSLWSSAVASPRTRKCVQWRDVGDGAPLSSERLFRATDEAWRCSPRRHPLLTLSPPPTRRTPSPRASPIHTSSRLSLRSESPSPSPSPASFTPATTTSAAAGGRSSSPGAAAASEERFTFSSSLPSSRDDVLTHLGTHGVQLEHAFVQGRRLFLTARVLNICFEKNVFARITTNNWGSFTDVPLVHQSTLSDPRTDAFAALVELTGPAQIALCFRGTGGIEHWDNNAGANYHVTAMPSPASSASGRDSPAAAA